MSSSPAHSLPRDECKVQQPSDDAVDRTLQLLDTNTQLRHDGQFLNNFGEQKAARVEREAARERATLEEDFRRLANDHLGQTHALNQRAVDLEPELNQARRKIQTLEAAAQENSFDADKLLAFLNDGSTELRGNRPRLRKLLKHFKEGTQPPSSWKTWLRTEAVDEPYRTYPPYAPLTPKGDNQGYDRGSDQGGKSEDHPPHENASRLLVMVRRLSCVLPPSDQHLPILAVVPRPRNPSVRQTRVCSCGPLITSAVKLDVVRPPSLSSFVPNSNFLQTEVLLDALVNRDTIPSNWPPLEANAVELFSPSSDAHGDPEDQGYDDAAERASSAQVVQGNVLVLDVESDEDETFPPPRRPSAVKRARSSSDSSSGEDTTFLSKSSLLPTTSAQLQRVPPSKKGKSRVVKASSLWGRSPLARVDFKRLSNAERRYLELIAKKPWKTMWRNRIEVLYFHRRSELTVAQPKLLDKLMEYIHEHRQAFWEVLHWVIMEAKAIEDDDDDTFAYSGSVELYQDRTARHGSVGRQMGLRVPKLISKGLLPSNFQEPGIWTYPCMFCYWFVKDPSTFRMQNPVPWWSNVKSWSRTNLDVINGGVVRRSSVSHTFQRT
ncbi:unnamed protein product [Phytophthora fragariaefolia]|uniref:Unnamed protein product n=1 Tax=Phytophthora fragariaefolia TaxID=1490495 RepID=A0A9W7CZ26_9STRA|nr:unnamed protein product [Phytophthora fragariaefolia]